MGSIGTNEEIAPNSGKGIEDYIIDEDGGVTQAELRQTFGIDTSKQIKLKKLSFMRYQHPDLKEITTFLRDFGLTVKHETDSDIWFKGYGEDQYVYHARKGPRKFLGGVFEVESREELERALKIPNAIVLSNGIEELKGAPGGGYIVSLQDPEGFPISLVWGQAPAQAGQLPNKIELNYEIEKPRVRKFQRFQPGPAAVHKLGHYGLVVKNFQATFDFYMKNFSFMPSNILYVPGADGQRTNVAVFAHVDRGSELVDHHTLFFINAPPDGEIEAPHPHHCSFEIHDLDSQAIGHDWLVSKGYKSVWGVGRHVLGSQIFDYWWDPNKFMVEHYIDGDIVNNETPVSFHKASSAKDAAWGPDVPKEFLE